LAQAGLKLSRRPAPLFVPLARSGAQMPTRTERRTRGRTARGGSKAALPCIEGDALGPLAWRVPARYEVRELIGRGSYGTVCEAADLEKGRMVAIKRLTNVFSDPIKCRRVLRELAIQARLDHSHVVRLHDIVAPETEKANFDELYIVMELGDADLKTLFQKNVTLVPSQVNSIMYNLLVGLKYLHTSGIYHRDLKPSNVLVNQDCCVKICDFGLARAVGEESEALPGEGPQALLRPEAKASRVMTKHVVTRFYRAPELILLQDRYTEAIDVWSAGCIYAELVQMLNGGSPQQRGPLFPGSTCFPLSPDHRHRYDGLFHSRGSREQLNVIFDILGTPSDVEVERLEGEESRQYIRCFARREGVGVRARLPLATTSAVDLLEGMLRFSPEDRHSVEEALAHEVLAEVRKPSSEAAAPAYITLEFESEPVLSEEQLRCCFAEEIRGFRRARAHRLGTGAIGGLALRAEGMPMAA